MELWQSTVHLKSDLVRLSCIELAKRPTYAFKMDYA